MLGGFLAMLVGIFFKINVVEQAHKAPVLLFAPIAQFPGVPAHHALDGERVL